VGKATAYRTGDGSRNEAALPVRGSMHGRLQALRVKTASLQRPGSTGLCKAYE